jgi:acyl-coenzyme A thioesterase PaaI-like protein
MTANLQTIAHFDLGKVGEDFLSRTPWIINSILRGALGFLSPFHRGLGLNLISWEKRNVEAELSVRRRLRNHNGDLHASAVALAGETTGLFLLLRNIHLTKHKVELKEVNTVYLEPAKTKVRLACELDAESFVRLKNTLSDKKSSLVTLKTDVLEGSKLIAVVRTVWNISAR